MQGPLGHSRKALNLVPDTQSLLLLWPLEEGAGDRAVISGVEEVSGMRGGEQESSQGTHHQVSLETMLYDGRGERHALGM